jgi:DNA sulfur modification protein DndD
MLFRELVLYNVGVYRGRQSIDLTTSPSRPVVLVGGLNGCGKTTLLDSLQIVLYGRRARTSNRGNKAWDAFLRETISRGVDPSDGASIELTFEVDVEGTTRTYDVSRMWKATGQSVREIVTVFVDGKTSPTLSQGWSDHIEELLPLDIASLFFFDGEKIESLADPETASSVVRTAVHSLLGIGTVEQLGTDLLALQRRQTPPSSDEGLEARVHGFAADLERLEAALDVATQRKAETESRHRAATSVAEKAERAFERDGGRLYEQRKSLESERSLAVASVETTRAQLRALAEGPLPLRMLSFQLSELLGAAEADQETLSAIQLLNLLRNRDIALLAKLTPKVRREVEPLLENQRAAVAIQAERPLLAGLSPEALNQFRAIEGSLGQSTASAGQLLARCSESESRRDEMDMALAGVPSTELIRQRLDQREDARLNLARIAGELAALTDDEDRLRHSSSDTRRGMDLAEADRRAHAARGDEIRRVLEHTDRVRTTLAHFKARLIEQNIGKLEIATLESFRALMRKQELIADLRIDPSDFTVHLVDRDGDELPSSRLSAGERQLLAVALLWGLARVAGHRLPTVVDTPLGRLDSKHRERLVKRYFPAAGTQVLLLSTDEEIDEPLLRMLEPSIASTYLLEHDDQNHTTSINSGYWWTTKESHVA